MSRAHWLRLGLGLLSLSLAVALYAFIAPRVRGLPVYMTLPDVTLIDQDGHPFRLEQTRGQVVVLGPIYTHCPDVCPMTTANMRRIQERLQQAGWSARVHLVTFTVDPERDSPQVLKRFASSFGVDWSNWTFLTGPPEDIRRLILRLGVYAAKAHPDGTPILNGSPAAGEAYLVNHTDRLFLADPRGDVRALTPGSQADVDQVMKIIGKLVPGSAG